MKRYVTRIMLIITCCFLQVTFAHAWWDCAWQKRSILQINNTGIAQTNALVELTLTATELPSYPFPVTTPVDIRIVDSNDLTELDYYIEPYTSAQSQIHVYVKVASLAVGTKNLYVYYTNPLVTSYSTHNTGSIFSTAATGVRLSTRSSSNDPQSQSAFFTAWKAALPVTTGYGCKTLPDFTNRNNAGSFTSGATSNILYTIATVFNVSAAQAGIWGVRMGGDYGRGGAIYVDGVAVAQNWTTNLWWANSWANTAQIISGTINLSAGNHYLVSYGAEDCCDGTGAIQLNPQGTTSTTWKDLKTTNFTLTAPSCTSDTPTRIPETASVKVFKTSKVISDPLNGTTNPKSIPGAKERYSIVLQNTSAGNFIDAGAIKVVDSIPSNVKMVVSDIGAVGSGPIKFTNSSPASGLTYTYTSLSNTTDDAAFSNTGATPFSYTPVAASDGTDANVKALQINPKGTFICGATGSPNSATFEFDVIIK